MPAPAPPLFQQSRRLRSLASAGLLLLTAPALSACYSRTAVDAASPAADAVRTADAAADRLPYPTFAQVPRRPTDVRPAQAFAGEVRGVEQEGVELQQGIAARPFELRDAEALALDAQARLPASRAGAAPAPTETDRVLREAQEAARRATPPPPPS